MLHMACGSSRERIGDAARGGGRPGSGLRRGYHPFQHRSRHRKGLRRFGYAGDDAIGMAGAIAKLLNATALKAGTVLRVGLEVRGDEAKVVRTSVYDGQTHLLSIALDDRGQFVPGAEPEPNPELLTAFDDAPPVTVRGNLPTVYDGIYNTAYSYGMSKSMTKQLVKLLASDVDFQSRLKPSDRVEVFFSQPDGNDEMSDNSELLYVSATFGGSTRNLYRFQMEDGAFDYFDEDGRSAKQFLLRNPLPNGKFRSGFGGRRHPILGYSKCVPASLGSAARDRRSLRPATASSKKPAGPAATANRRSSVTPTATKHPTTTRAGSAKASSLA